MIAALAVGHHQRKTIPGFRQGAPECDGSGRVAGRLDAAGSIFSEPRLYVLDGGNVLKYGRARRGSNVIRCISGAT